VDTLYLYCFHVLEEDLLDHFLLLSGHLEVLATGEEGVVGCNWLNLGERMLLDTICSECTVDVVTEVFVIKHEFGVVGFVLMSERIKFFLG